jgi:hypothetical protein
MMGRNGDLRMKPDLAAPFARDRHRVSAHRIAVSSRKFIFFVICSLHKGRLRTVTRNSLKGVNGKPLPTGSLSR